MPSFWLAVLLILLFAVQLGWLPAFGFANPLEDPLSSLKLMILPALTLGLSMCAAIMRQLRSSMLNVLSAEYMKTARAKGLGELVVLRRHAIRNALIPVVTIIGVQATVLISGTVITETIFTIPGLGRLAVYAIESRASPGRDYVVFNEYSRGQAFQPSEHKIGQISVSDGGMGIDATKPLGETLFERAHYPVEKMDFSRWFSEAEIKELKALQDPYFRWLGEKGYG